MLCAAFSSNRFQKKKIEDAFSKISKKKNPRVLRLMTFTLVNPLIHPDPDVGDLNS
jgi:hypothetical protein